MTAAGTLRAMTGSPLNTTNCHLYHYTGNNPVRYIDPDGRDATNTIDHETKSITLSLEIVIYGDGASELVAQIYQRGINEVWGGTHTTVIGETEYTVAISATVVLGSEPETLSATDARNYIRVTNNSSKSETLKNHTGHWRAKGRNGKALEQDNPAPHEAGHLLGLKDRYTNGENGYSHALPGWRNNIMATGKEVNEKNIKGIMKRIPEPQNKINGTMLIVGKEDDE